MCKLQKIMASALFMGVFLLAVSGWAVSAGQARKAAAQSQGQSGTEANPVGQNANQPGVPGQSAAGAETPSVESAGVESGRVESSEIVTTIYGMECHMGKRNGGRRQWSPRHGMGFVPAKRAKRAEATTVCLSTYISRGRRKMNRVRSWYFCMAVEM